ncbi:Signal peptidase complex subunit 1 [Heterocephalus glaber]|uniref:Signal peptidase complex subunit 1 n=1 Tax=Heterocephalus glaber TaxID=10181 RepID=G5BUN0_HETGA|nr:Signal peptidase complex subunit 1 [Heterocephalus glaber]
MSTLPGRGRGFRRPSALRANPSRMRDALARSPPQPSRVVRQARANFETTRRLATARGGATGCPGLPETSASGASSISELIVGFIYGYVAEQFGWTVYIVMAGFAFSCLVKALC